MKPSKIFKINDLVDLRLIGNSTHLYVNNKSFLICARLVLNIPTERIQETDEIRSIDEAAEVFKQTLWQNRIVEGPMAKSSRFQNNSITPEEEFKGHCSNIQAFFENGLNTNILHSNIAFPLLKKLVDLGYEPAMRVFKEEIVIRFNEGTHNSRMFLYKQRYLNYLKREERLALNISIPELIKEEKLWRMKFSEKLRKEREARKEQIAALAQHYNREWLKREDLQTLIILLPELIKEEKLQRMKFSEKLRKEREARKEHIAALAQYYNREWLKKEYGENHELFETLQAKLKERKETELSYIAERQRKREEQRRFVDEYKSKPTEPNYLNSDLSWSQADPPPFLAHIAEWIAGKIALRKVGRKYKKRNKNR